MSPDNEKNLERFVHQALRELPSRRAPASLEQRVFAELERRAALPWRQKGFAYWPVSARLGFIALSGAVGQLILWLGMWAMAGFDGAQFTAAIAGQFAWLGNLTTVLHALVTSGEVIVRNIPSLWFYGAFAVVAVMCATLCGLGTAAYRTLYADR